jgi:hypothetical protein
MLNLNEGIRALSSDEIAAVAGAGAVAVCSPRLQNIQAIDRILDCNPCGATAKLLDRIFDSLQHPRYS